MLDYQFVESNYREALCWLARALPKGEVRRAARILMVCTGVPAAAFNVAMLAGPVEEGEAELARAIQIANVFFSARDLPWCFCLCPDWLPEALRQRAWRIFERHGLELGGLFPGMLASELESAIPPGAALLYLPIDRPERRQDFCEIASRCFGLPKEILAAVYDHEEVFQGPLTGYLGCYQQRPVTTAATFRSSTALGVYNVATLPEFQGRGFAEAAVRHAIAAEQARRGPAPIVLQATPQTRGFYRKMGFKEVTELAVYLPIGIVQ